MTRKLWCQFFALRAQHGYFSQGVFFSPNDSKTWVCVRTSRCDAVSRAWSRRSFLYKHGIIANACRRAIWNNARTSSAVGVITREWFFCSNLFRWKFLFLTVLVEHVFLCVCVFVENCFSLLISCVGKSGVGVYMWCGTRDIVDQTPSSATNVFYLCRSLDKACLLGMFVSFGTHFHFCFFYP